MTESTLVTGDLVLCTVGSYEPWPAVVVPQRILSGSVLRAKENAEQAAVAFFNDSTYYWTKPKQLKRLTTEDISVWIKSPPKRSLKELKKAYQLAAKFDSLQEFIEDRLTSEGRVDDLESIGEVKMGEDPLISDSKDTASITKRKVRKRSASDEEAENDSDTASPSNTSNGNGRRKPFRPRQNDTEFSGDSSAFRDLKKKKESSVDSLPTSVSSVSEQTAKKRSKLDYSRRVEIAQIFRNKLQKSLIQRDSPPSEADLAESEKLIRKILAHTKSSQPEFFDLEALRVSKLHKLLKVITSMPELSQFHESCNAILDVWAPHVLEIKKEKLKQKESAAKSQ